MSEFEVKDTVAFLTLTVPPINALDESALRDLMKILDEVEGDDTIRALVIASGIKGIFCSGGNLKYWPRAYPKAADTVSEAGRKVFTRLHNLDRPTIAAIDGQVIGDGVSLALACDIRIASPACVFRLPELDYGLIPGWGTIGRLLETIGMPLTAEMLLFGQQIPVERAQSIRLVNRITSAGELITLAGALAKQAAAKPPTAMFHAKAALQGNLAHNPAGLEDWETACFRAVWGGPEWQRGIDGLFRRDRTKSQQALRTDNELSWPPMEGSYV